MTYAKGTEVTVERSKAELDGLLSRHGAAQRGFASLDDQGLAIVTFRIANRHVRIELPLPKLEEFRNAPRTKGRSQSEAQHRAWEQACRERWRLLVLAVKAKLELVALGVSTHEREFLSGILLADGRTVGDAMAPLLVEAYRTGANPPLQLGIGGGS